MSTLPASLDQWLTTNGYGPPASITPLSGGCINHVCRLSWPGGQSLVGKWSPQEIRGMYEAEALGLKALVAPNGPTIPKVVAHTETWLLMADLGDTGKAKDYWPQFGRALAELHTQSGESRFGFAIDNWIGATEQPNPWSDDGVTFFAEHRLAFQGDLALSRGTLSAGQRRDLDHLIGKLGNLLPNAASALIHGDLWSGNAAVGPDGEPALIDPATHHGWAEAELAMTTLFGGFPPEFYAAYEASNPSVKGWRQRSDLYNLYHLLNHLNLFGSGYLGQCLGIIERYR